MGLTNDAVGLPLTQPGRPNGGPRTGGLTSGTTERGAPTLSRLEADLGYRFKNPNLLRIALVHGSAVVDKLATAEDVARSRRMAWYGDSLLGWVVSDDLVRLHPNASARDLARRRVAITRNAKLAEVADELGLEDLMVVGKPIRKQSRSRHHEIRASALEAVFAAVRLDGGFEAARTVIRRVLGAQLREVTM